MLDLLAVLEKQEKVRGSDFGRLGKSFRVKAAAVLSRQMECWRGIYSSLLPLR